MSEPRKNVMKACVEGSEARGVDPQDFEAAEALLGRLYVYRSTDHQTARVANALRAVYEAGAEGAGAELARLREANAALQTKLAVLVNCALSARAHARAGHHLTAAGVLDAVLADPSVAP